MRYMSAHMHVSMHSVLVGQVVDPLLEKGKAKWNKAQAKKAKRQTEWAQGRRDAL